jgi:crotonobetainyl-CoA:carnitine CoA-transferase CaiB-like acyl-CoA transferase
VWSELASTLEALLAGADVVVLGYRPASLARLGLDPADLAARHPPGHCPHRRSTTVG